jgi:hypothetical protein
MAIAVGQKVSISNNSGTTITTGSITTAASGSIFVVGLAGANGSGLPTPTDSKGNTYTPINAEFAGLINVRLWYCENGTGGSGHTFSMVAPTSNPNAVYAMEITGGLTSGSLDQTTAWIADASSPYTTNTSGTTAQNDELAVVFYVDDRGGTTNLISWGNSYSLVTETADSTYVTGGLGAKVLTATGTQQGSITIPTSSSADGILVTFKAAGATQSQAPRSMHQFRLRR